MLRFPFAVQNPYGEYVVPVFFWEAAAALLLVVPQQPHIRIELRKLHPPQFGDRGSLEHRAVTAKAIVHDHQQQAGHVRGRAFQRPCH